MKNQNYIIQSIGFPSVDNLDKETAKVFYSTILEQILLNYNKGESYESR